MKRFCKALCVLFAVITLTACGANPGVGTGARNESAVSVNESKAGQRDTATAQDESFTATGDDTAEQNDNAAAGSESKAGQSDTAAAQDKNFTALSDDSAPRNDNAGARDEAEGEESPKSEPPDEKADICTMSIDCKTVLYHLDELSPEAKGAVPDDGVILDTREVVFSKGDTVYDLLDGVCREERILMEVSMTPGTDSAYVEGINGLYQFDCGDLSGWQFCVNGEFLNTACSEYEVEPGDRIEWRYTCAMGDDLK